MSLLGPVQSKNVVLCFATVSGLNNMFPLNGVQQTFRYVFSRLVDMPQVLPNPQRRVYKLRCVKNAVHTMDLGKVLYKCSHCGLLCSTLEEIKRHQLEVDKPPHTDMDFTMYWSHDP